MEEAAVADSPKFRRTRKSHGNTRLWVRVSVLSNSTRVSFKQSDYELEISIA